MPPFLAFRSSFVAVALLLTAVVAQGGITSFTDRGKTDFDTALQLLNGYGTWSKIDDHWAYTPLDHHAPYTNGRWIYTEYGWYWKGSLPDSWATEHYGYWKRGADQVWSRYHGPLWLPTTEEIRTTSPPIGWRSAEIAPDGKFVEPPIDRYSKPEEWAFVTLKQFTQPITPAVLANLDQTRDLLDDSTDSMHTYLTYREIDRPGPHPADFLSYPDVYGGIFPPRTMEEKAAVEPPKPIVIPGYTPAGGMNNPATKMTGTNAPSLLGTDEEDNDPNADRRQVKYWITMSLPTFWTKPPADARAQEIYLYRPDFYQDNDGIERRVTLWFNPYTRIRLQDVIAANTPLNKKPAPAGKTPLGPALPAVPAVPASSDEAARAFRSPLDDSYHAAAPDPAAAATATPAHPQSQSSKVPVPAGLKSDPSAPTGATNAP